MKEFKLVVRDILTTHGINGIRFRIMAQTHHDELQVFDTDDWVSREQLIEMVKVLEKAILELNS